ncbi:thiamine transport system ATP-binding protein [Onishia taeanensis]|uniref:Thiamine transport system ATP-binding protein n=1 Tax=Onishia taeanensis TaxID=284577 RepID=A0A328XZU9_9GAMM|nr:ATP-binding cassette domain-containing protein [Halomonas taeanensis]RAR62245.1 thiamine transport system ATP-binding protein [Halomonas taeanensis]
MLSADYLSFHYTRCDPGETPDFAFTFRLAPGECLAVSGPSGAGKSTLLNLLAGFLTPSDGRLSWLSEGQGERLTKGLNEEIGENLIEQPPWARGMTTVFQDHNLFEHLPVWINVGLGLASDLRLSEAQRGRILDGLAEVGLDGLHDRLPGELSGGQQQRVALLRSLLRETRVLLLDEPFSGLDRGNREALWGLVRRQQAMGVAVLLVSHDPEDVEALAQRRLQLLDGRLEAL